MKGQNDKFDIWNIQKKEIQETDDLLINFSEREVWWCVLGKNIGNEEDGKNELFERPVLVLRKFNKYIAVILPLTTKGKNHLPFYHNLSSDGRSYVILSQIRLVSTKRFLRKMYRLGRGEFSVVKEKIRDLIL